VFGSVVAGAFQIAFHAEMHANDFFYFLKIIFDINTLKRSKKYKPHSILTKKKIQIYIKYRYKRSTKRSLNHPPKTRFFFKKKTKQTRREIKFQGTNCLQKLYTLAENGLHAAATLAMRSHTTGDAIILQAFQLSFVFLRNCQC